MLIFIVKQCAREIRMGRGLYRAGSDFTYTYVGSGTHADIVLVAKDFRGDIAHGLKLGVTVVNLDNPNEAISIPETMDQLFEPAHGIIRIESIDVYPRGLLRFLVCAADHTVATGACRYSTSRAERQGQKRILRFEGQRNALTVRDTDGTNTNNSEGESSTIGGSITVKGAPLGVGADATGSASGTNSRSRSRGRLSSRSVTRTMPRSVFQVSQIVDS